MTIPNEHDDVEENVIIIYDDNDNDDYDNDYDDDYNNIENILNDDMLSYYCEEAVQAFKDSNTTNPDDDEVRSHSTFDDEINTKSDSDEEEYSILS